MEKKCRRCAWVNPEDPIYIKYHDEEWGIPLHDDHALYELFLLETFQAGLSWATILHKRENFRRAYEGFLPERVAAFDTAKVDALMQDAGIVRNRRKIEASITNSRVFLDIFREYGSFDADIWGFTEDLKRRGMKFVGSTSIYSTLQAIGVLAAHAEDCDWRQL